MNKHMDEVVIRLKSKSGRGKISHFGMEQVGFQVLESVGCVIDDNGITYPMLNDGGYDKDGGCHIKDIENDEWNKKLSHYDKGIIDKILEANK